MRIFKTALLTLCLASTLALPARAANSSGRTSVLDAQENQYSATVILETASGAHIRVVKRDSFGGLYWAKDFTSSRGLNVGQVRVDGAGSVYVALTQLATASAAPIYTLLKYTSTGSLSWSKTYTDSSFRVGGAAGGLVLDSSGSAYVLLWGTSSTSGTSSRLLKYSSAGTNLFVKNIQPQSSTHLDSMRIDGSNNIYVSGEADPGNPGAGNLLLARYDTFGNQIWQRLDAVGSQVGITDLALDGANQPVAVTSTPGSTSSTLFAEKVTAAGGFVWSSTIASGGFEPRGVIVDASGAVAITGNDYNPSVGFDTTGYHVARLDGSTGAVLWNVIWPASFTYVTAIAEEASHSSYLTVGEDGDVANTIEIRVVRFNEADGSVPTWFFNHATQENHGDNVLPSSVAGDFYVTGRAFWSSDLFPLNWKVSGTSSVYNWITTTTH